MAGKEGITATEVEKEEPKFTKEMILNANIFSNRKDAIGALISDEEKITITEVKQRLERFMKGVVE